MQQMAEKLTRVAEGMSESIVRKEDAPPFLDPEAESMRDAAVFWSCLEEFRDELLRKGLMVSAAIADFLAELESSRPAV